MPNKTQGKTIQLAKTLFIAVIASIIAFAVSFRLDVLVSDYILTNHGNWQASKKIVVVTIDENTLATLPYRSPIDRGFLSSVIKKLDIARPVAIGLDLLIDQASEAKKDQQFFTTLKTIKTPIILGYATKTEGLTKKQITYQNTQLNNIPKGLVTLLRDNFDGTIRQTFSSRVVNGQHQSGLAAQLAKAAGKKPPFPSGRITYYSKNEKGSKGQPFAYTTYPAHTVQFLPAKWFTNKIVLIGPALHSQDRHTTPFTTTKGTTVGNLYGVHIHAHILNQFLNNDHLNKPNAFTSIGFVLGLALIAAFIAKSNTSPLKRTTMIVLIIIIFSFVAFYLFTLSHIQIPFVTPILATVFSSLFFAMRQWFKDREQRQFIESAFSQYVSPAIVSKIITNNEKLELGGELRQVTYIFTDLKNFTTLCEGLEPTQIATLLNDYLEQVCALFVEADATIDKIIGDAVVGFFGAPEPQEDQAERAVALALKIDQFSQEYCKAQRLKNIDFGITRIGIHKGDAVIGNFGGKRFMDYTGIGDTVNTAARLEAANKLFGTRVCVSNAVAQNCQNISFRPIGDVILKGKHHPIPCYEPITISHQNTKEHAFFLEVYNSAFALMKENNTKAKAAFAKLKKEYPSDPLINFHATRLRQGERGATIEMKEK